MSAVLAAPAALRAKPRKTMKIPSPTTSASRGIIDLYLDGDHAPNNQVAYEDHETADRQQDPTDDASEHRPEICRRHEVHERREHDGQGRDQRTRCSGLSGQGRDLALDAYALADRVRDVVEDLGQVAADRAVDRVCRRHEVEVGTDHALGDVRQRLVGRTTEVHLAHGSAELVADGRHRVLGHGVDGLRERVAGLDGVRQQGERVAQLVVEGLQPLADPVLHVDAGYQVAQHGGHDCLQQSPAPPRDEREQRKAADLDHEVLRRAELEISALELLGDRRLAFLGVATTEPVGRGLEQVVERVAEAGGGLERRRPRGRHAIRGQTGLEILRAAGASSRLSNAQDDQENGCRHDETEDHRERQGWHLDLQKGSVQLIRGWLRGGLKYVFGNVLTFGLQVLHTHRNDAGGGVVADGLALRVHADLAELEDLLVLDLAVLDAGDLGHAHDAAHATAEPGLLDDHVDGRADRLADGA